jgi:hypothetical protein
MYLVHAVSFGANATFGLFLLLGGAGLVLGWFTVRGSGISNHPHDGRNAAPGAKLPDEFHQFEARQIHDADMRKAQREERIESRVAHMEEIGWEPRHIPHPHMPHRERVRSPDGDADR